MKFKEKIKGVIKRAFLKILPAEISTILISEGLNHLNNCAKNRIWYWGRENQIQALYEQLNAPDTMFWKAHCTKGQEIRKVHVGLPALIVDSITNIVISDYNGIDISSKNSTAISERWEEIEKENDLEGLLEECLTDLGIVGDGAFKISYDEEVSKSPIIEWYPAEKVVFNRRRGRIYEVEFTTEYTYNNKIYKFVEVCGYGYVNYHLFDSNGRELYISTIPQTEWTKGSTGITFDDSYMLAVPVILGKSFYKGRGKGLLEDKDSAFDSLDESWSQWLDALRSGRTKTYMPMSMIPVDPNTGEPVKPNPFDNRFIEIQDVMREGQQSTIRTETPTIQCDQYLQTYITALDLCIQGIISPSTLGIDTKKLDNAEAQREKEKATLYTRQQYIKLLTKTLPKLVTAVISFDLQMQKKSPLSEELDISVNFGEYANPSFESQIETVGKGKQYGILSTEASVEELYGDSKSDDWKAEEVKRIKEEQGIITEEESAVNIDGMEGFNDEVEEQADEG